MVKTTLSVKFYKSGSQECNKHGLDTKPDISYDVEHSGSTSKCEHLVFCLHLNQRQPIFEQPDLVNGVPPMTGGLNLRDLESFFQPKP